MSTPIRDARRKAGITQAELAERSGVSPRTIATAEAGGHVSKRSAERLQAALSGKVTALAKQDVPAPDVIFVADQRRGTRKDLREIPSYGTISWDTADAIRNALQVHMNGQFQLSAQLLDAMMGDDRITGVMSARLDGLLGLPIEMTPPDGLEEDTDALDIARDALKLWPVVAPESSLREILRWGRGLGVAVWENVPLKGDPWTRWIRVWHPRYLYWIWDITRQPYSGSFRLITNDGLIELTMGDDGVVHSKGTDGVEEIGRFGLYTPYGYQRGWYHGLVRSLAIPWLVRNFTLRDWARYSEVHGIPIRAVTMPVEWDPAERARAEAEIAVLGSESVVKLLEDKDGRGFKLELVEPKAQSEAAFEKLIAKCDTALAVAILGQNLTTEIGGSGSRAAAQVHDRVRDDIIRSDAATLSTAMHDQVIAPWTAFHYGDPEVAPWPKWSVDAPEDIASKSTALNQTAAGIQTLRQTQLPVDWAMLCEEQGIPLQEGVTIDEFEPPQPPPLPGKGDGEDGPKDEPGDDADTKKAKEALRTARAAVSLNRHALTVTSLSRRSRSPFQGQEYVDALAANGRDEAARILRGDVLALKRVLADAKPGPDGKVNAEAIRKALIKAYRKMKPDQLAQAMLKVRLLAEMSGRYAVQKEVLSK